MRVFRALLLLLTFVLIVIGSVRVWQIGPRNIIGRLRYDQRREGALKVGDEAPDVALAALDGKAEVHLRASVGGRPLVLIFGSYT